MAHVYINKSSNNPQKFQVQLCYWDKDTSGYGSSPEVFIPEAKADWNIKNPDSKEVTIARHIAYVEARSNVRWCLYIDAFSDPTKDLLLYVYLDETPVCEHIIEKAPAGVVRYIFSRRSHANGDSSALIFRDVVTSDSSDARCDPNVGSICVGISEVALGKRNHVDKKKTDEDALNSSRLVHEQKAAFGVAQVVGRGDTVDHQDQDQSEEECRDEYEEVENLAEICLLYRPRAFLRTQPVVNYPKEVGDEMDDTDQCSDSSEYLPERKKAKRWGSRRQNPEDATSLNKNSPVNTLSQQHSQRPNLKRAVKKELTPEDKDDAGEIADDENEDKEVDQLDENEAPEPCQKVPMAIDGPRQPQEDSAEANTEQPNQSSVILPDARTSIKRETGSPYLTPNANRAAGTPVEVKLEARSSVGAALELTEEDKKPRAQVQLFVERQRENIRRERRRLQEMEEELERDAEELMVLLGASNLAGSFRKRQRTLAPPPEGAEIIEIGSDST